MGIFDRVSGSRDDESRSVRRDTTERVQSDEITDDQAIARYRYLLRTAPPEAIEQDHEEAFAQLTPDQRAQVLRSLVEGVSEHERSTARDDPRGLARLATRAEMRQPGTLERSFAGMGGGGIGLGGMMMGSLLASVAGAFIGTAIAESLFDADPAAAFADDQNADQLGGDQGDPQAEELGDDFADQDDIGGDVGGDFGGDFGGEI